MRITENRLRRIIRSVIKLNEHEDCYSRAGQEQSMEDIYGSTTPGVGVEEKIEFYRNNEDEWDKVANAYYQAVELEIPEAHKQRTIAGTGCDNFKTKDYYHVIIGVEGKYEY